LATCSIEISPKRGIRSCLPSVPYRRSSRCVSILHRWWPTRPSSETSRSG